MNDNHEWYGEQSHMRLHGKSAYGGSESKCDEQIVGKGAKDTTYQDIRLFLACRAHPQRDHLCPSPKRHDGSSYRSLAQIDDLCQTESTLNNGWAAYRHCCQTAER